MIPGFIHFSAYYLWNSVFLRAHLNSIVYLFSLAVHLQPSLFTYLDFSLTLFTQEDKVIKDSEMWAFSHKKNWVFKCQNNDLETQAWIMWKFQVSFRRDLLMAPLIRIICWWQGSWLLHGVSSMLTWSSIAVLILVSFYNVIVQSMKTNVFIQFQHCINVYINISFCLYC